MVNRRARNCKEAIVEALQRLNGCGTISEVEKYIFSKYGDRWKDVSTTMADLCPGSSSSLYKAKDRVLERVGRGKYCLRSKTPLQVKEPKRETVSIPKRSRLLTFSFRDAENLLKQKNQLKTITEAASLTDLSSAADHNKVQQFLSENGWDIEVSPFPVSTYRLDAFKDRTGVEIERSLIDAIHRSLFRCLWSHSKGKLDLLIFLVPTYKEPEFRKVKRDLQEFKDTITFPVYVIGINRVK